MEMIRTWCKRQYVETLTILKGEGAQVFLEASEKPHECEQKRCQQIGINSYPDSPLFISTGFLPRVSSKRLN